ncbi:MAG: tetratricopeptide repeat protein [Opitutaceae bacterium]
MADDNLKPLPATPARKLSRRRRSSKPRVAARLLEMLAESFPKITALLKVARDWSRRKPLWIRIPLYSCLILGAGIYVFSEPLGKLPLIASLRGEVAAYVEDVFSVPLPKASGKGFAIAVARIEDDENGSVGRSLGIALKISGVERLQVDRRLRYVEAANLDAAEAEAHTTARRWLGKIGADLLLWGQTIPGESHGVRLIMTVRDAESTHEARASQRYLAFNFLEATQEPFEAAVQAQVLGFLARFDSSHAVAGQLRQAISRLESFVRGRQEGPGRAALVFALANAQVTLGEQAGDDAVLRTAIGTYQELLNARSRQTGPLDWAMTQNNLGNALVSLGKRENGIAKLLDAVAAYGGALEEYDASNAPLEWAMVQNNLGHAFEIMAPREGGIKRLEQAVAMYRGALTKFSPDTTPADWAMTQNNLGNALVAWGTLETSLARLTEAVAVFEQALKVRTRKKAPLSWAMTQGNLGNALGVLGERETGTRRLEQSAAAYREALKEYTREKVPLDWAMTQNNLGTALGRLGQREKGTGSYEQAVGAFRAALLERTREKLPLAWAMTQNNLGNALRSLGERERRTEPLEEAIAAYRAALQELTREKAPFDWAMTNNNLGGVLKLLGERTRDQRHVEEAIQMFERALSVRELKSAKQLHDSVQTNLWAASALLATLEKPAQLEE